MRALKVAAVLVGMNAAQLGMKQAGIVCKMREDYGRTRDDFAALGSFRGDAKGLYAMTRSRDWDIQLWDWIEAASPRPELSPIDQIEGWVSAWLYCSRWAGTVGRRPAFTYHVQRAGIGPLIDAAQNHIVELADGWRWPAIDAMGALDDEGLETTYALFEATDHVSGPLPTELAWKLALKMELAGRGQLPRLITELSDYDGAERVLLAPTQLFEDKFGRTLSRSRLVRIVDEWCEFFEAGPTPIRCLNISSRAPKRLVSALRGQSQLRELEIKWGDYDDISAVAEMPDLWNLSLGGASGLSDVAALRSATSLRVLAISDCRRLVDLSPLGDLHGVEEFSVTSGFGSGSLSIPSIAFVSGMSGLRRLFLGARVLDADYSPLLARANLEELLVRKQRDMHPSMEELERQIPGFRTN